MILKSPSLARGFCRYGKARLEAGFLYELGFGEVFFQRDVPNGNFGGGEDADIAQMPGLVGVASDILFVRRIPQDEAILSHIVMDFAENIFHGNHLVVVVDDVAVFCNANVNGEAGMVFGIARFCDILLTVFSTILVLEVIPEPLLVGDGAINAV